MLRLTTIFIFSLCALACSNLNLSRSNSRLDNEAQQIANDYWQQHVVKCGEDYFSAYNFTYGKLKAVYLFQYKGTPIIQTTGGLMVVRQSNSWRVRT